MRTARQSWYECVQLASGEEVSSGNVVPHYDDEHQRVSATLYLVPTPAYPSYDTIGTIENIPSPVYAAFLTMLPTVRIEELTAILELGAKMVEVVTLVADGTPVEWAMAFTKETG